MSTKTATYKGRTVDVVEKKGGWTTILDGMKQLKVRNSELGAAKADTTTANLDAAKARLSKKADKPAKPAKAKKAALAPEDDQRLIKADLTRYEVSDVKTASGRKAIDVADDVAKRLRGADISDAYREAAHATGQTQKALREKYEHLNPGMQRMNLGNLIRGAASKAAREAVAAK